MCKQIICSLFLNKAGLHERVKASSAHNQTLKSIE